MICFLFMRNLNRTKPIPFLINLKLAGQSSSLIADSHLSLAALPPTMSDSICGQSVCSKLTAKPVCALLLARVRELAPSLNVDPQESV